MPVKAVLFDWGDTLMQFAYDPALVEAGQRAGLETLARPDLPDPALVAAHFRERYEPFFWIPGTVEELEYPGLVRQLLGDFGVEIGDDELTRFPRPSTRPGSRRGGSRPTRRRSWRRCASAG